MLSKLPVIQQDCQVCPIKVKCWDVKNKPKDEVLVINLLVCRLQLGVKKEATTKLLLQLLDPKIKSIASYITKRCESIDKLEVVLEVQSAIIEYLMVHYKLAGRAWPLHYLFARPKGVMTGWTLRYLARQRAEKRTLRLGLTPGMDFEGAVHELNVSATQGRVQSRPPEVTKTASSPDPTQAPIQAAQAHVEDGFTLTAREYRVMRFCMTHAGTSYRGDTLVSGLHTHLCKVMGIDRSAVSKIFRRAATKIVEVTGQTERVLGIKMPSTVDPTRRRNRVLGLDYAALTAAERSALIMLSKRVGPAKACGAFGVNPKTLYLIRNNKDAGTHENNTRATHSSGHEHDGVPTQ